jgi:hypothetical protein
LQEREGSVPFIGDASNFWQGLTNLDHVTGLLEQLFYVADHNQVDDETVFEFPAEDDLLKIVYGPPFTIVFKNLLDGTLIIYSIFPYGPH